LFYKLSKSSGGIHLQTVKDKIEEFYRQRRAARSNQSETLTER
jgi:hypothetical protein